MSEPSSPPVEPVYSLVGALVRVGLHHLQASVHVAVGQPAMPMPWKPRMQLQVATLFVHPARERAAIALLNRQ